MKKIIICGATSGIGRELSRIYAAKGYKVGVIGRREDRLNELCRQSNIIKKVIDINLPDAPAKLLEFIDEMGGIDTYFHSSGIGWKNVSLDYGKEISTVETNCLGFTRMIATAFNYFAEKGSGRIAAISSIAGTKGLGAAPAYSASKRFQRHYLESLQQLAAIRNVDVKITDIRPGFVDTELLSGDKFPLLMSAPEVAKKIFQATEQSKRKIVVDWRYAAIVSIWRMIPDIIWERLPIK